MVGQHPLPEAIHESTPATCLSGLQLCLLQRR